MSGTWNSSFAIVPNCLFVLNCCPPMDGCTPMMCRSWRLLHMSSYVGCYSTI
jgi:hypothetical protein